ncbi:hypothetical protein [Erythrobacter mangrovi]|uniref:Uncharacterized protein n=1 Tax=Erythrobacter mangrovi TaxID=2739433 RepID=A0A7D3XAQ6_9SPHN|nr:hypothetical protein [Erythrobacter mangrovi]QKG70760.1 hypothetical protein HQR01_04910 [Erythrobacter mangrovi]
MLIVIALLRILVRPDLDHEDPLAADEQAEPKASRRATRRARRNGKGAADA